jgi:hydrogenase maturation protease
MAGVLVLGIGNPLRGDDGVGWRAASELASRLAACSAQVLPCHQLTPELAQPLAGADRVIFIDAATGAQPGVIQCRSVHAGYTAGSIFSHHLTPPSLLECTRRLFGACPEAVQVTVTGESFGYAEGFSPPVETAFPQLLQIAETLVRVF